MEPDNFLSSEEREWRSQHPEEVLYKHYLKYLTPDLQKILSTKVPLTRHSLLPPRLVAEALQKSVEKNARNGEPYMTEWHQNKLLLMSAKIYTSRDMSVIAVFRYLQNPLETVILMSSQNMTSLSARIDEILKIVYEKLYELQKSRGLLDE